MGGRAEAPLRALKAGAYEIPTDKPEADGTFAWASTTIVVVEAFAGDRAGLGYTYSDGSIVGLVEGALSDAIGGLDAFDVPAARVAMRRRVRNLGRSGLAATAISAVDCALWDLKARLLEIPLGRLLGQARPSVPVYGSGGFTTYSDAELRDQLAGWTERDGCRWVKMKIGSRPGDDPRRVAVARDAIGDSGLFVDANGAFDVKQALSFAEASAEARVGWFEEPVTSDDPDGLRLVRERAPASMEVAAGEYVYGLDDARRLLDAGAVDVLQADVTRCGGISGFLEIAALCDAFHTPLSGHCAPAAHLHAACAAAPLRHLEWFHDHARIEAMLFDGAPVLEGGSIRPDLSSPGNGLRFKRPDAERLADRAA